MNNKAGAMPIESTMGIFWEYLPFHMKSKLSNWHLQNVGNGILCTKLSFTDWVRFWDEELSKEFNDSKVLSELRKKEVIKRLPFDIVTMILQKKEAIGDIEKKWAGMSKREIERLKGQEAWYSVNPTSSESNYRFQIGFRNNGCKYWRDHQHYIGCLNCGYFFETFCGFVPMQDQDLINQFDNAYEIVNAEADMGVEHKFDVIEFLSDGSFLNDIEVPENVRKELFRKINKDSRINKILIESRPEYVTKNKISNLLNELTQGQKIEIAMGLETTDKFILTFCINKGYDITDVEKVLKKIIEINNDYQNRCSVLLYVLVKSAYLNEREALEDAVATVKNLYELKRKYNINIIAKLEPVVVPKGTILDVLYHDKRNGSPYYFPPSYWTILEILARLEYEGISNFVRIGAREDMDRYFEIPAVYYKNGDKKGMLSRYDFLIYEAVQEYNSHHNFKRTLIPLIGTAFKDSSLDEWKKDIKIEYPFFIRYYEEYTEEIEYELNSNVKFYEAKKNITNKLIDVLNIIEYGEVFQQLAEKYQKNSSERMQTLDKITLKIKELIEKNLGIPYQKIKINDKDIALMQLHEDWNLLRMHIKISTQCNGIKDTRSVWVSIPTTRIQLPIDFHRS
jgi:radical SAM enzyme (TIGR01210 family)